MHKSACAVADRFSFYSWDGDRAHPSVQELLLSTQHNLVELIRFPCEAISNEFHADCSTTFLDLDALTGITLDIPRWASDPAAYIMRLSKNLKSLRLTLSSPINRRGIHIQALLFRHLFLLRSHCQISLTSLDLCGFDLRYAAEHLMRLINFSQVSELALHRCDHLDYFLQLLTNNLKHETPRFKTIHFTHNNEYELDNNLNALTAFLHSCSGLHRLLLHVLMPANPSSEWRYSHLMKHAETLRVLAIDVKCEPWGAVPDIELFSDFEGFVNIASSFRVLQHLSISFTTITKTGDAYPYENSLVRVVVSVFSIHAEHSEVQMATRKFKRTELTICGI